MVNTRTVKRLTAIIISFQEKLHQTVGIIILFETTAQK
jgi:hypothetical protein